MPVEIRLTIKYTDDVAAALETIVAKAKGMLTEIAVVNYLAQVA